MTEGPHPRLAHLTQDDRTKVLFDSLLRHYDLVLDRRRTLSGQAASLMTFAGVIETILLGSLMTLATNESARQLIAANPNYSIIVMAIFLGFAAYLSTACMSILSYVETSWTPAPVPIMGSTPKEWRERLDEIHSDPSKLSLVGLEMQLITAISRHQLANNHKYILLLAGYIVLVLGVMFSAMAGFLMVFGLLH